MFLTASNLVHYLGARGTISTTSVVDADFAVVEAGRRNRNYKVLRRNQPGLFIKQVKSLDAMSISTLQREAACYRLAQGDAAFRPLAELMPRFVAHDPARHILILELLDDSENLNEHYFRQKQFPAEIGKLLGASLGRYHSSLRGKPLRAEDLAVFPRQTPWILSLHHSYTRMPTLSGGTVQLAQILLQHPELHYNLDRLRNNWRHDSVIHGDVKWDNCMIRRDADDHLQLKIVDWELVDYGDASWDVGAVFQAYLVSWIYSMPVFAETDPTRLVEGANCKLESLFPSTRAFWQHYCAAGGIAPQHASAYLLRCIEYGAARLVQTAFEYLHTAPTMTNQGAILLQACQNILRDPQAAAAELFGLSGELS